MADNMDELYDDEYEDRIEQSEEKEQRAMEEYVADLRDAIVEAALAKRRAGRRLREARNSETAVGADRAWNGALRAYEQAADALLAFLGEGHEH